MPTAAQRNAPGSSAAAAAAATAEDAGEYPMATRDAIIAAKDIHTEVVSVPEWGLRVRLRSLSGHDRDLYDAETFQAQMGGTPLTDFRARRIAKAMIDDTGRRLFSDADVALLARKSAGPLDRLDDVVLRLSGMGPGAAEKAKAALKATPNDGSGSA